MDASDLPTSGALALPPPASLFDALPDAMLRVDASGRIVYVNAAFERAASLPRGSLLGRRFDGVAGLARYSALWQGQIRAVLESEEERWFKFCYEHPLGRRHFDVRLMLERDTRAPYVTALLRDVTYTRDAVRASRGADALADAMLSADNFGIALLDRELRFKHFNRFLEELTGLRAADVLGRRPDEVLDVSGQPDIMASYRRMAQGQSPGSEHAEYLLSTSARVWVRERRTPILDARGTFDGVFILIERIDSGTIAESSLSALRGALEQAGEIVLEVAMDGTLLDANQAAQRVLGVQRTDCGAISLLQIDCELNSSALASMMERLRAQGRERRETRFARRDHAGASLRVDVVAQRLDHAGQETVLLLARDISERKRVELALVESAERFRTLFDESPVALLVLDENLRVLQANGAAGRLLDRAVIDLIGAEAAGTLRPGDSTAAERLRRSIVAEALHETDADVQIVHADGQAVWARLVVRGWRLENGRRYLLVLEDYTERKRTQLQLESALSQQRTLLQTMATAVAQARAGRVVSANSEFARLFGVAEAAVAGMPLSRLTDQTLSACGPAPGPLPGVEAGRTCSAETMLLRADGRPLWCLVQVRAIEDGDVRATDVQDVIYTFQDVSAQREDREALARSLLELNLVFDSTEVALLHLADGRIVRCNAQAVAMFGGGEGPVGRAFTALVAWSAEEPVPSWLDAGRRAAVAPAEVRMIGADGETFWALVSMRAVDALHPAAGQIVTVLNIDARKRSEQEMQQMRQYLDLVVESLPVSVAVRDARDGRFISINRAGEALLGRPRAAVVGRTWQQLYPRPFADEMTALDERALQSRHMVDQPRAVGQTADGRPLTVHRRVLPIFDAPVGDRQTPAPRYLMSIVDDLTEAARTEVALQDSEAHFRELAEHIDAFVFIADRNLERLTYASPRCEALLGIPPERLQADPRLALERVQPQERPALARRLPLMLARLARLRRTEMRLRIDHPLNGRRTLAVQFTPVRTPAGDLRVFGMAEDVTEHEAAQEQRLAAALQTHEMVLHEARQRLKKNLQGVAGLLQQRTYVRPELGEPLTAAASQIQAIGLVHGMQSSDGTGVPLAVLVPAIFSSLAATYSAVVQLEPPAPAMSRWRVAESEAVPLALVINELGGNAIRHRGQVDNRVFARIRARGDRVELRIEQPGRLKEGFDLARVTSSVTGLGLAKALLPLRGTRLRIEQLGPLVITRLELMPPAITAVDSAPEEA